RAAAPARGEKPGVAWPITCPKCGSGNINIGPEGWLCCGCGHALRQEAAAEIIALRQRAEAAETRDLVERLIWEADAIESHLTAKAPRPDCNQRKTVRLLRHTANDVSALRQRLDALAAALRDIHQRSANQNSWSLGVIAAAALTAP